MELPDDVLALVREYSRPWFTYFKEYNHALKVLGKKKWIVLLTKLQTEPEHVLPALHTYLDALIKKKEVYALRESVKLKSFNNDNERWIEQNEVHNWAFYAKRTEEELFWLLIRILYGDGKSYWDFRIDHL